MSIVKKYKYLKLVFQLTAARRYICAKGLSLYKYSLLGILIYLCAVIKDFQTEYAFSDYKVIKVVCIQATVSNHFLNKIEIIKKNIVKKKTI